MKRLIFTFVMVCFSANVFLAQPNQNDPYKGTLMPARLKPLLTKRLRDFVEIQQREEWGRLFDFLSIGQQNSSYRPLTEERKQCIVEQFKANPMLDFTTQKTLMTTANFNQPLNKQVWFVHGDAQLKTSSGKSKQSISTTVRYFNQNWFFSIPEFYYEQWEQKKYAQIDLSLDKKELLKVMEQPGSPVEIIDISVKISPKYFDLRNYKFKVRNKTKKKIVSYGYNFIESGEIVGSSNDIDINGFASDSGTFGANQEFCEDEERSVRIFISSVQFSDGTEWKSKFKRSKSY